MRRRLALALAAAALAVAGCSTSPCQELGQKLCACTGLAGDTCKTQVEQQLSRLDPSQSTLDRCAQLLTTCGEPGGAIFCEWIKTTQGMQSCGLIPDFVGTTP